MVDTNDLLKEMEKYAKTNNIPIMQKDGIEYLINFIETHNIKNILEIGTAIAYSSIKMALLNDNIKVTTIEKDNERFMEALKNVKKFDLEDRITLIYKDANEVKLNEKFDLIFIDAAKSQNENFFLKFEDNLSDGGYIITDNLSFHGYVEKDIEEIESKNIRGIVRKVREYIDFLDNNSKYETEYVSVGDKIAISKRVI